MARGAKEEIERLEVKIDVLYNTVRILADACNQDDIAAHIAFDLMSHFDVTTLTTEEHNEIGKY